MSKEKSAKELGEIMSSQLDKLVAKDVTSIDIKAAEATANVIGKQIKLATLEMAYAKAMNTVPGNIPALSR